MRAVELVTMVVNGIKPATLWHGILIDVKDCVRYILASLFFKSKREYLSN